MPYFLVNNRTKTVGPQGAVISMPTRLVFQRGETSFPATEAVSPALAYERRSVAVTSATPTSSAVTARASRYSVELRSLIASPLMGTGSSAFAGSNDTLQPPPANYSKHSSQVGSPLQYSAFLASSFNPTRAPVPSVTSRVATTLDSALSPRLVHGLDVQACFAHVALQKRYFFEEQLAELHTIILGAIPPSLKPSIAKSHPDALKKCVGVLGAIAAVYGAKQAAISPMPSKHSKNIVELHKEARELSALDKRPPPPRVRKGSLTNLNGSIESANPTPNPVTPKTHRLQSHDQSMSDAHDAHAGQSTDTNPTLEHTGVSAQRSSFILSQAELMYADELLGLDDNERLLAVRQQVVQRRAAAIKEKDKLRRKELGAAQIAAFAELYQDYMWSTRRAEIVEEQREWEALKGASTSDELRLSLASRYTRRNVMAANVAAIVATQEAALREESVSRAAATSAELIEASRSMQRLFAQTEQTVKGVIKAEREARLREVLQSRKQQPTVYFPAYEEDEVDNEFVPSRIATAAEAHENRVLRIE